LLKLLKKVHAFYFTISPSKSDLGSGSAFVIKTQDPDPDPQEIDANPKPWKSPFIKDHDDLCSKDENYINAQCVPVD